MSRFLCTKTPPPGTDLRSQSFVPMPPYRAPAVGADVNLTYDQPQRNGNGSRAPPLVVRLSRLVDCPQIIETSADVYRPVEDPAIGCPVCRGRPTRSPCPA